MGKLAFQKEVVWASLLCRCIPNVHLRHKLHRQIQFVPVRHIVPSGTEMYAFLCRPWQIWDDDANFGGKAQYASLAQNAFQVQFASWTSVLKIMLISRCSNPNRATRPSGDEPNDVTRIKHRTFPFSRHIFRKNLPKIGLFNDPSTAKKNHDHVDGELITHVSEKMKREGIIRDRSWWWWLMMLHSHTPRVTVRRYRSSS